jgi:death-on-curing protein
VRYLTLDEAMKIAEDVTGIDADTLARVSRIELPDSALHAPSSGFGDEEFYLDFFSKAAVLGVRIAMNHPLPDGNKRLAWASVHIFHRINDFALSFTEDEAVGMMLGIASGKVDVDEFAEWLRVRASPIK